MELGRVVLLPWNAMCQQMYASDCNQYADEIKEQYITSCD